MDRIFEPLEPFGDEDIELPALTHIWSRFRVPRMPEKPQDPIIETLRLSRSFANIGVADRNLKARNAEDQFLDVDPPPLPILHDEDLWHEVINCTDHAVVRCPFAQDNVI